MSKISVNQLTEQTPKAFGAFMRQMREQKKMSREEVSILANVSSRSIYNYESGTHTPNVLIAHRIFAVLDVNFGIGTESHD